MRESMIIRSDPSTDGFEGVLYAGDGSRDKVVIVMMGSNGGIGMTRREAAFYHRHGIPALALALFKTKGTQKDLDRVPVEYVQRAIAWLKSKGYRRFCIDGASKGSEMALLAASMFRDISCVIARVPSHFVSEGLISQGKSKRPSGTSCWGWQGRELPFAPYRSRTFDMIGMLKREKELHIITFNREKDVTDASIIPIEKIRAPILLISSKQDSVWPSYESAVWMAQRLKSAGFSYPVEHMACEHMSHAAITSLPPVYRLAFRSERERPRECTSERAEMGRKLLYWVTEVWDRQMGE